MSLNNVQKTPKNSTDSYYLFSCGMCYEFSGHWSLEWTRGENVGVRISTHAENSGFAKLYMRKSQSH